MASIFIVFRFIVENEKFQAIYRDKRLKTDKISSKNPHIVTRELKELQKI